MTKWIIKHFNTITICSGVVTLYLFVQFFRHGMTFNPLIQVLGWCLLNLLANYFMTYPIDRLMATELDVILEIESNHELALKLFDLEAHDVEYESLLNARGKFLNVALAYAIPSFYLSVFGGSRSS